MAARPWPRGQDGRLDVSGFSGANQTVGGGLSPQVQAQIGGSRKLGKADQAQVESLKAAILQPTEVAPGKAVGGQIVSEKLEIRPGRAAAEVEDKQVTIQRRSTASSSILFLFGLRCAAGRAAAIADALLRRPRRPYVGRWSRGAIEIWSSKTSGGVSRLRAEAALRRAELLLGFAAQPGVAAIAGPMRCCASLAGLTLGGGLVGRSRSGPPRLPGGVAGRLSAPEARAGAALASAP